MITLVTLFRFLTFRADAIRRLAGNRSTLAVGLLLVLSAGLSREYDGEYLRAEPWHLALPLIASVIGCTAMVAAIGLVAYCRGARQSGVAETCLSFLGLYWMTAPMAWLYAIPVERFLSPGDATRANLWLLGLVAAWRVALMIRCVNVLYGAHWFSASVPILLFSDVLALLALRFVPGPIFMIMGGVRLNESENVILGVRMMLGFIGVVSLPVLLICYIVVCNGKRPWKWSLASGGTESDESASGESQPAMRGVSLGTWAVVAASLLIWIGVLPLTQPEQALRWEAERMVYSEDFASLARLTRDHPESAFPPHWDPPPRVGYGESEPPLYSVLAGLIAHDGAAWIRDRYEQKVTAVGRSHRHYWEELYAYTDEELDQYVTVIGKLDDSREMAANYVDYATYVVSEKPISDQRRASLERLLEMAKEVDEPGEIVPYGEDAF